MAVKKSLSIGALLFWVGCSIGNSGKSGNADSANENSRSDAAADAQNNSNKDTGSNADPNKDTGSNADPNKDTGSNVNPNKDTGSNADPNKDTGSNANPNKDAGSNINPNKDTGSNADSGKVADSNANGDVGRDSASDSASDANSGSDANTGPCEYECTDFCLNSGGVVMPGTCSKSGYVCCNVEATEIDATGKQFYIDSKTGNDSNDGSSPEKAWKSISKIKSATSGSVVNLNRGSMWESSGAINVTNLTLRPYGKGPRPFIKGKDIIVPQSLGTVVLKGKSILDAVKVSSDQGFGAYINGDNNEIRNVEVDGTGTGALMGIGIVGNTNKVTNCYVHDLTTDTGDTGDVNSSGGAEGIVLFGGSHIDVGHNTVARAHCKNKTLGGDEGGCTEIIMNPLFFTQYGKTIEDVQFHHNLCVDTVGLFESCQGTGDPGFDPTKDPGTIKDITVAYNVVLDSKWMYLAQLVNTIHKNVVFEHNTIIHGPRNDKQWSTDAMSHEYMFGMFFTSSNGKTVSDSLTAADLINRNNMFYEPFTKEDTFIGVTSGHNNNLFGPSTVKLEKRWTLAATEKKVDDLGLVDVFHPTASSPAVDKGSDEGKFDSDFYGNKKCGSAPDIGAVEFCEDAATKPKSDEIAKYLKLNQ
jgi:hypothetical protein